LLTAYFFKTLAFKNFLLQKFTQYKALVKLLISLKFNITFI